jgi:hypothetical protein
MVKFTLLTIQLQRRIDLVKKPAGWYWKKHVENLKALAATK